MRSTVRRVSAGTTAWIGGALASVTVSMLALSSIGGLGSAASPLGPAPGKDTDHLQDATSPAGKSTPGPAPSLSTVPPATLPQTSVPPTSPPPIIQRQFSTAGGEVVARCTGQQAYLVSWSPAPGFQVDDLLRGPGSLVRVSFDNGPQGLVVRIHCVANIPQVTVGPDT